MAEHSDSSIDADTPLPVKSLRSRFEQLSTADEQFFADSDRDVRRRSAQPLLTPDRELVPRPRASSGTFTHPYVDAHHLRSSSSASDLPHPTASDVSPGTKRPPPPPPSPRRSPLLRPAPPPSQSLPDEADPGSVSALRNKFNSSPNSRVSSPRPETQNDPPTKPVIPLRPSMRSSESDSTGSVTPPNLPARRISHPRTSSTASSSSSITSNETTQRPGIARPPSPSSAASSIRSSLHRPVPPPPHSASSGQFDSALLPSATVASLRNRFSLSAPGPPSRTSSPRPDHPVSEPNDYIPAIPQRQPIHIIQPIAASPEELTPQSAVSIHDSTNPLSSSDSLPPTLPPRRATVAPSVIRTPSLHSQGASSSSTTTSDSYSDTMNSNASSSSSFSLSPSGSDPFRSSNDSYQEPSVSPAPAIPPRPSPRPPTLVLHPSPEQVLEEPFSGPEHNAPHEASASPTLPPRKFVSLPANGLIDSAAATRASPTPPKPPPRHRTTMGTTTSPSETAAPTPSRTFASRPIPPPPRPRPTIVPEVPEPAPSSASSSVAPPPLPVRRGNAVSPDEAKPAGMSRLPPPPTRTIAIGDKLPPARRPQACSSDEDSGDEVEQKDTGVDLLPDSSHSSRRPPVLPMAQAAKISVPTYTGHVCVSGTTIVVASHHHVKIYELAATAALPVLNIDTKEMGAKDAKITSLEMRTVDPEADRGCILWVGTREGHLIELDTRTGAVLAVRYSAHLHPIVHIFRYGRSMASLDDSGKALVFDPESDTQQVDLQLTTPRVVRVTEKLEFVKVLGGRLWTAARGDAHGHGTPSRTPIIRIYDLFNLGAGAGTGRSVMPTEHVGPVTAAAILPSEPETVYVGHEEGFVSVWMLAGVDGWPKCTDVVRVSTSDVLSLEGVNNRLWAGGRNGMIAAYDVTVRPWVVTNSWAAHPGLPVLRLAVDHYGIEKAGHLCVISVGRDEQVRFWDGLLGSDWIDDELAKHEKEFSQFRDLRLLVVSWNVDAAKPDALTGSPANISFLQAALSSVDSPDVIVFGFQEVIDLESRKMTAKNVLLGKKRPEDGGLSDRVTGAYKRWYDRLVSVVRASMPPEAPYAVVHTESLVGLFTCIFVKNSERPAMRDMAITTIKRGVGGRYGNKVHFYCNQHSP
ncbi:hypothetical protein HGRIS_009039 [Hohenbuehelia grisea]|uniref:Inositol polyphosphate-related phosphatase domain-containing protein n=1 Tax=Hohenbuehelia grisea TaxID=104357 RepID=A0ABR3IZX8_9AGAR